jgi:peptidoglycan/LPS O-acetylase OafA/YrhL
VLAVATSVVASVAYVPSVALGRFGMTILSLWLIDAAATDRLPLFGWGPLRSLGTISYGVYLWHQPIAWGIRWAVRDDPIARETAAGGWAMLVVVSLATFLVAMLSWRVLERPLNALKERIPYDSAPRTRPTDMATSGA